MNFFRRNKNPAAVVEEQKPDPSSLKASTEKEYQARGLAHYARGEAEKAETDLRKAISMNADSVDAHYNLGLVLKSQDRHAEAKQSFEKALKNIAILEKENAVRALLLEKLLRWHVQHVGGED